MSEIKLDPKVIERLRTIVLSGKRLDDLAAHHGLVRWKRKFLWIFKVQETDKALLTRVLAKVRETK